VAPETDLAVANPFHRELLSVRQRNHGRCVACDARSIDGLHVDYHTTPDSSIEAGSSPRLTRVGCPGRMHGGVIAALLDGAVTDCPFQHDIVAVTT
jgi:hypothetical protein